MASKKILIISEYAADFYSLGAALDRAGNDIYQYVTVNTRDQPVDSLMDPSNDAVILAYTEETEYLLRLAEKKDLSLPIILLIDPGIEAQAERLKAAGATDYVVRGFISDDTLHRVLDYTIVLSHLKSQRDQLVRQQQIERSVHKAESSCAALPKTSESPIDSRQLACHQLQTPPQDRRQLPAQIRSPGRHQQRQRRNPPHRKPGLPWNLSLARSNQLQQNRPQTRNCQLPCSTPGI